MMSSNLAAAENGGMSEQTQANWWLARWSGQLACLGATILFFSGILTCAFNIITLNIMCVFAGGLQLVAACLVLAIEGSSFVSFLTFAKPVGLFFVNKPVWLKTAVYAALTVFPMTVGCSGFWITLGFLISAGITALYGMLLIGRKAELDDMRQSAVQPSSP